MTDDIDKDAGADGRIDGACPLKRRGLHEQPYRRTGSCHGTTEKIVAGRLFCAQKAL